jgi:hypothetical protein
MTGQEEEMAALVDALGITEPEPLPLSDHELVSAYARVTQRLLERGETLRVTTDEGRRLHEERESFIIELSRRGLR